ncbi:MAG TPA: DUF3299 domain-containing protein [Gemmataceae bacterium]|nr:DUF3299 domain-containing protein [Gemmataceae bacterium]
MKNLLALVLLGSVPLWAQAGVYYSGETIAELPSQWRGFLVDQRSLRYLAVPPAKGLPPSPFQTEYRSALARLEKKEKLSADEIADLGALYIRLGQPGKAVEILRPAQRQHPEHFRIAANLGAAWQLQGDLAQAAECLREAVKLAPPKLRVFEEYHLKLVRLRLQSPKDSQQVDDLFGVKYVGEKGAFEPGTIAAQERKKLPANAVAIVQQLALWLPADTRLLWQLADLANADGDIRTASAIFDGLVTEFAQTAPELRQRRQQLKALADALPSAAQGNAARTVHEGHQRINFRSPRPLVRKFDVSQLPEPSADRTNVLPWGLLTETTLDAKFRPSFPEYLKKLDGKSVSVAGFMQPLGEDVELSAFLLIEYPVGCWFCETPPPNGILLIEMPTGKSATLRRGLVKIEGKLKLNATDPEDFLFSLKDAVVGEVD